MPSFLSLNESIWLHALVMRAQAHSQTCASAAVCTLPPLRNLHPHRHIKMHITVGWSPLCAASMQRAPNLLLMRCQALRTHTHNLAMLSAHVMRARAHTTMTSSAHVAVCMLAALGNLHQQQAYQDAHHGWLESPVRSIDAEGAKSAADEMLRSVQKVERELSRHGEARAIALNVCHALKVRVLSACILDLYNIQKAYRCTSKYHMKLGIIVSHAPKFKHHPVHIVSTHNFRGDAVYVCMLDQCLPSA